jgi:hypothetical protein
MRKQKDDLQVAVAELEARLAALKAKQVERPIDVDDSQVNKCNVLLEQVRKTIKTEENKQKLLEELGPPSSTNDNDAGVEAPPVKPKADVLDAAKKAIQDDDGKVVDKK